jgi:fructose-bisphosphate aldolase class II
MPVATPKQYAAMFDAAQQGDYAYPAINVTSISTINAALKAFADKKSDGIIQVSTGGGEFASGGTINFFGLQVPCIAGAAIFGILLNLLLSVGEKKKHDDAEEIKEMVP